MRRFLLGWILVSRTALGQSLPESPSLPEQQAVEKSCHQELGEGPSASICFDPGRRLYLSGGSGGIGWGLQLRHTIRTEDAGVSWRMEHGVLRGSVATDRFRGVVYEGRFLRHSREGYLLLPGAPPRRLAVPFDVGLETGAGQVEGRRSKDELSLGAIRGALLLDFARSNTFLRRVSVGVVARWDLQLSREQKNVQKQAVSPFSMGYLGLYIESADGLTLAGLSGEAGYETVSQGIGWRPQVRVDANVERVVVAFNDHPLSVYVSGRYEHPGELRGEVGLRIALLTGDR